MIPKDLKVGDVFEDGGFFYKVLEVKGDRYSSTRVEKPAEKPAEPPKPKKTTTRKKKAEE